MAFKLFERKRAHGGPPAVSITKNGMFVVNSTAVDQYFKGTRHIQFYWDADQERVGIKPLSGKTEKAYKINYSPKGNVGTVSGTAFLSFAEIPHKETKSFPAKWNEEEKLLEFTIERSTPKTKARF
jgi:hypothetical protein